MLDDSILELIESRLAAPTTPPLNKERASSLVKNALGQIVATRWPKQLMLPNVYVASTIARSSWIWPADRAIILHDEGIVDTCVAAAETIIHVSRVSTSFVSYPYFVEQLVANNRSDLAFILAEALFGERHHPKLFRDGEQGIVDFVFQGMAQATRTGGKVPMNVITDLLSEGDFTETARTLFLCHELAHYIYQNRDCAVEFARPLRLPMQTKDEEAFCDLLAIALTCCVFGQSVYSGAKQFMPEMIGRCAMLLTIHSALCSLAIRISGLLSSEASNRRNELLRNRHRTRIVTQALSRPSTVKRLMSWAGSQASYDGSILAAALDYGDLIHSSLHRSFSLMNKSLKVFRQDNKLEARELRQRSKFIEGDRDVQRDVVEVLRNRLGQDRVRSLSLHSAQIRANLPGRSGGSKSWLQDSLPAHRKLKYLVGVRTFERTNGVFLDMSGCRILSAKQHFLKDQP